jgi:hypothetical protein
MKQITIQEIAGISGNLPQTPPYKGETTLEKRGVLPTETRLEGGQVHILTTTSTATLTTNPYENYLV